MLARFLPFDGEVSEGFHCGVVIPSSGGCGRCSVGPSAPNKWVTNHKIMQLKKGSLSESAHEYRLGIIYRSQHGNTSPTLGNHWIFFVRPFSEGVVGMCLKIFQTHETQSTRQGVCWEWRVGGTREKKHRAPERHEDTDQDAQREYTADCCIFDDKFISTRFNLHRTRTIIINPRIFPEGTVQSETTTRPRRRSGPPIWFIDPPGTTTSARKQDRLQEYVRPKEFRRTLFFHTVRRAHHVLNKTRLAVLQVFVVSIDG